MTYNSSRAARPTKTWALFAASSATQPRRGNLTRACALLSRACAVQSSSRRAAKPEDHLLIVGRLLAGRGGLPCGGSQGHFSREFSPPGARSKAPFPRPVGSPPPPSRGSSRGLHFASQAAIFRASHRDSPRARIPRRSPAASAGATPAPITPYGRARTVRSSRRPTPRCTARGSSRPRTLCPSWAWRPGWLGAASRLPAAPLADASPGHPLQAPARVPE